MIIKLRKLKKYVKFYCYDDQDSEGIYIRKYERNLNTKPEMNKHFDNSFDAKRFYYDHLNEMMKSGEYEIENISEV